MVRLKFLVHYVPKDNLIDLKNIPFRVIDADSKKDAVKEFNSRYPDDRVLYVRKLEVV